MKKLEQDLEAAKQEKKEKQAHYENCNASIKKLEKSIKDHGSQRETRLKDLDKSIKSIKTQMQLALKKLKVCILFSYFPCVIELGVLLLAVLVYTRNIMCACSLVVRFPHYGCGDLGFKSHPSHINY